jgi:uncharacterized damage-inducible protein DinB
MDQETLRDLFQHQQWADNHILNAIRNHAGAAEDPDLRRRLHHMVDVQRGFLALIQVKPFDVTAERRIPDSFDEIEGKFHEAHAETLALVDSLDTPSLARSMDMPWIPGLQLQIGQALLQVAMHSQHHRAQCAMRLRELGATPPMVDYILWLKERQGEPETDAAG